MKTRNVLFLAAIFLFSVENFAQSDKKKEAYDLGMRAIQLMDKGEITQSIELLEEAKKLDPENIDYPYEIAYAHYLNKDYKQSIKLSNQLLKHPNVNDRVYQILGNSYSLSGDRDGAISTYEKGIQVFPTSGKLYLERGNMELFIKDYDKALGFYEKGIEVDPRFPSNYYRAAKLYLNSEQEVWGMIYGELFMNLERNSQRTVEISKLLYDTYKSEIKFTNDSTYNISFCSNVIVINDLNSITNALLPFGTAVYEQTLLLSMLTIKEVNCNTLNDIRRNFVQLYFVNNHDKAYPNALFSYQQKIDKAGHTEAYNHWILMKGDEACFDAWQSNNVSKWEAFAEWFQANPLQLSPSNKFFRGQY